MSPPRTAQDFWDAAAPMIAVTEKHPFLTAMVDGSLAEPSFRYYVVQDALYLKDFANCLRRLSQTPGLPVDESTQLKRFATGAAEAELSLHNSFFRQWNIAASEEQMPHTLLYTSYMERIVATRSYAEGLATLLPCFWVYMHVGNEMLKLRDQLGSSVDRPPQYDAWIDMYGGDEFGTTVREYIALVDGACATATDETRKAMQQHFNMACRLEHMFWDQANDMMQWPAVLTNPSDK